MQAKFCGTWSEISDAIEWFADTCADLDAGTIANARRFVAFATSRYIPANEVGLGYWPTLRLCWTGPIAIEIEVHLDHYEFYRFRDGSTEIAEVPAVRDGVPSELGLLLAVVAEASAEN